MITLRKRPKTYAILAIALVVGAFLVASWLLPGPKPSHKIEGDLVGICVHSLSANEAALVNEGGARWIRIDASDDFGEAVTNAKAYNLSVLGILDSWMFNKATVFTLEEWRGNVTHYVSQYADYVDAWEIWNEPANPNINNTLLHLQLPSQENMTKIVDYYYSMAQITYPIIRQYDPTAQILLFGGLNLYSGGEKHFELDENFSSQLAAKGIEQYGDAISIHAYPWGPVQPQVWESYTSSLAYYRGLFTNKSLEVWVTETGQPIEASGEDGQARYLADALTFFRGKVTGMFWYSLLDNQWEQEQDKPQSFGLIRNETIPRPSYDALQNFTKPIDK